MLQSSTASGGFPRRGGQGPFIRHIPTHQWDEHRNEIEELYLDWEGHGLSLAKLTEHMREKHGFVATYDDLAVHSMFVIINFVPGKSSSKAS
jgi:Clr5 domain